MKGFIEVLNIDRGLKEKTLINVKNICFIDSNRISTSGGQIIHGIPLDKVKKRIEEAQRDE